MLIRLKNTKWPFPFGPFDGFIGLLALVPVSSPHAWSSDHSVRCCGTWMLLVFWNILLWILPGLRQTASPTVPHQYLLQPFHWKSNCPITLSPNDRIWQKNIAFPVPYTLGDANLAESQLNYVYLLPVTQRLSHNTLSGLPFCYNYGVRNI